MFLAVNSTRATAILPVPLRVLTRASPDISLGCATNGQRVNRRSNAEPATALNAKVGIGNKPARNCAKTYSPSLGSDNARRGFCAISAALARVPLTIISRRNLDGSAAANPAATTQPTE